MRVVLLGPADSPLLAWLEAEGESVITHEEPLTPDSVVTLGADFLVSYGYRHILRRAVLDLFPDRAFNLHISYLPWNRGADPNLWSFVDDTPKGVTIHHIDAGVDTGDIVIQRLVRFEPGATLRTSYDQLQEAIQESFREVWPAIRAGRAPHHPQRGEGSSHRSRDKEALLPLLTAGWDTPVDDLRPPGSRPEDQGFSKSAHVTRSNPSSGPR